jgi:hypothetical protein
VTIVQVGGRWIGADALVTAWNSNQLRGVRRAGMLDAIVEGGTVVFSGAGCERLDVLIREGKVVGLVADGSELEARSRFDAKGLHVLPDLSIRMCTLA